MIIQTSESTITLSVLYVVSCPTYAILVYIDCVGAHHDFTSIVKIPLPLFVCIDSIDVEYFFDFLWCLQNDTMLHVVCGIFSGGVIAELSKLITACSVTILRTPCLA